MSDFYNDNKKKNPVYGIIGVIAVFVVGGLLGYILNGSDHVNKSTMTEKQCIELRKKMNEDIRFGRYDELEKLNNIFSENCNDRDFKDETPKPVEQKKLPESTCGAIEELLKANLYDENSGDWKAHMDNSEVYQKLAERGCPENAESYAKLAIRESKIAQALNPEYTDSADKPTCEQIEGLLTEKLKWHSDYMRAQDHIERAQIYANLSERGCAERSGRYKELAKKELDIARALNDDNLDENPHEATEMVETYKRLQMQEEAMKMIEKAKKLTNPAIDFIIQLEKIIEE